MLPFNRTAFATLCRAVLMAATICGILSVAPFLQARQSSVDGSLWDQRVADLLGSKHSGDIVVTALGDMIWTREISTFQEPEFQGLYRILQNADITYGNLEMSLNDLPELQRGLYNYGKRREFAWEIAKVGVNLVSLANNHALDFGIEGFKDTLRILDQTGIAYAGGGLTPAEAFKASSQEFGRTTFSLLSFYSQGAESSARSGPTIAMIEAPEVVVEKPDGTTETIKAPLESDIYRMEDAIRNAKARADIVMVHFHLHWVSHSRAYPIPDTIPPHQQLLLRRAVDAGADVVLGNGPHVLRGIEIYRGKPIFYSLGNFVYQYKTEDIDPIVWTRDQQQDIVEEFQTVIPRLTYRDGTISRIELIPVELEISGERVGSPRLAGDERGARILDLIQQLSSPLGTGIRKASWYAVIDL